MTEMKNSVVIRMAKGVLMTDGWTRGTMGVPGQPHCVLGAFREVIWGSDTKQDDYPWDESRVLNTISAAREMERCVINDVDDEGYALYVDIVDWNDEEHQTIEAVLAKMEECAQAQEAMGQ